MLELCSILLDHKKRYPYMTLQDVVLLMHQAFYGCTKRVCCSGSSPIAGNPTPYPLPYFESIGNGRCRLHLSSIRGRLCAQTIERLPHTDAAALPVDENDFDQTLSDVLSWCVGQGLYSRSDVERQKRHWQAKGYDTLEHSPTFCNMYAPDYCIVGAQWQSYWPILELIEKQSKQKNKIIGIDGRCASGKSILANCLSFIYSCDVVHMDDFFLPPHRKTIERLSQPGGNVDRERFYTEVIAPSKNGVPFSYGIYCCKTGNFHPSPTISPSPLLIVEGVYCLHPLYQKQYDLKIFLSCSKEQQLLRILQRNGEKLLSRFVQEWIPLEECYFDAFSIKDCCNLQIDTDFLQFSKKASKTP